MRKKFTNIFSKDPFALKFLVLLVIISLFAGQALQAQTVNVKISGTVKDQKGEPVIGASVIVKGKNGGTVTNVNGAFTLNAPAASTLVFTSVGYTAIERVVPANNVLNVVMEENINMLNAVEISTGFGAKVKRSDLTAPVASVSAKDIQERQPTNIFEALQGKASGVQVVNDGGPGAEGTIQIRGVTTLNSGAGPLYVVDGVITENGRNINPLDIQSIEVLKDAATASIYGVQAANGVILITTKKGVEGKPNLNVQYTHLFGRLANKLPQSNAQEVRAFRRLQAGGSATAGTLIDSLNPAFNADNDLQALLLGNTGHRNQVNLSVGGASKTLNYYSSVNYQDDQSIVLNSYAKTLQTRLNVTYAPLSFFKYTANVSLYYQTKNEIPLGRTVSVIFDRPSYSLIYYPDGSLTSYIGSKRNPVANAIYETNKTDTYSAQVNNQIDIKFFKDLNWTSLFNLQYSNPQYTFFAPRYVASAQRLTNNGTNDMQRRLNYEVQSYLNYSHKFGDHSLNATAGYDAQRRSNSIFHIEFANSVSEAITVALPAYILPSQSYTGGTVSTQESFFGRFLYNYKSKYFVTGIYRNDASSRFGPNQRRGSFYSGSAAWRFSAESFMNWSKNFLDDAKIRASYGRVGNDQIPDFASQTLVDFSGSYNGVGGAAIASVFGNQNLRWETNIQKNFGIDLAFLKGRLNFTGEYYIKGSDGLLYQQELAKETGYSNIYVNVGSIENKGVELSVNATPISKKNFSWVVDANITFNRGVIKQLDNGVPFVAGNKWYVQEGGRLGDFYGWRNLGVYQWNESNAYNDNWQKLTVVLGNDGKPLYVNGKAQYTFNGQPYTGTVHNMYDPGGKFQGGDTEWQNMNRDSLINDADRHVIGNAQPSCYLGFGNTFTYEQFSLNFLFNASVGGQIYNSLQYSANNPSNTGPGNPDVLYNSWQKQGDIAKYPYYPNRTNRGSIKANGNSAYLESASFLRLQSIRLAYVVDPKLAKRIFLKGLTGFIYGTNLLTWTNYRGYDPEFSTNNPLTPGDDTGRYPKRREVGLGININL